MVGILSWAKLEQVQFILILKISTLELCEAEIVRVRKQISNSNLAPLEVASLTDFVC